MRMEYIEQLSQLADDGSGLNLSPTIPPVTPQVEAGGAQLNDILSTGDGSTVFAPTKTTDTQSVSLPSDNPHTLTSTFIQKADDLGATFRSKVEHVTELIKAGPDSFSLQNVMLVQMEMHSITLEMDLLSGCTHKASQYVDQLSKIS